jgi:hypothetical protein
MRPYLLFVLACACALCGALAAQGQTEPPPPTTTTATTATAPAPAPDYVARELQRIIDRYRRKVWHWQRVMGHPVTLRLRYPPQELAARVPVWQGVAKRTWKRAQRPPHAAAWHCIHRFEGSWTDPHAPYYGGLQMDLAFQRRYGGYLLRRKGTADRWTPLEQMWVAERALRSGRGFYPWPNTARYCGLI